MKRSLPISVIAATAALTTTLSAQWPLYPYANVPRTPDGKLNLTAPAPRTADGKPDLSGVWQANAIADPNGESGRPPLARFGNTGIGFKDDLPFQSWARELQGKRSAEFSKDNPDGLCLPESTLQLHLDPQPFKIVQTPRAIYIIYETNYGIRTIYTDGRPLPPMGGPQPNWFGYSVGRWDGDTLVVTSNGFREGTWLDRNGSPMSDAAKLTERYRRVNYGRLEIDVTLDDPKVYTRPWTVTLTQLIVLDTELLDYHCMDNERDAARLVGK